MADAGFSDATLMLVAHGSTANERSAEVAWRHVETLRGRQWFAAVQACFWKQAPGLSETLDSCTTPRVFVVPLMMSEGYFTEQAIPEAIGLRVPGQTGWGRAKQRGAQALVYCRPVGTHPSMGSVVLDRAAEVVARHPFPRAPRPAETALLLPGHGTERDGRSRQAVEGLAAAVRARGRYASVSAMFLEEAPRIAEWAALATARHVVVVPCFMSEGLHTLEDIPVLLGEPEAVVHERLRQGRPPWRNPTDKRGHLVWYSAPVGTDPSIADVILERVREAAAEFTLEMPPHLEAKCQRQTSRI